MTKADIHPEHVFGPDEDGYEPAVVMGRWEKLGLVIETRRGTYLSESAARTAADEKLKQEENLGGWGGPWTFVEMVRRSGHRVDVVYEA